MQVSDGHAVSSVGQFHISVPQGPSQFGQFSSPLTAFAADAGGWTDQDHFPRLLADVNGDGMADIVGFSGNSVIVSLATGGGHFGSPVLGIQNFTVNSGGWTSQGPLSAAACRRQWRRHGRFVAFRRQSRWIVSLATGGGHFASPVLGIPGTSTPNSGGWTSQDQFPRELADVNGDGMADIVAFGGDSVIVSLATGGGHFASPVLGIQNFTPNSGGLTGQDQFPRELADVNGDGMADIVAFGGDSVIVSLATGGGHFASPILGIQNFTPNSGGWNSQDQFPRELADVNGDGMADIVAFGGNGAIVSLATGGGHFASPVAGTANFASNGGWASQDLFPRFLGDVTGDHAADIIGLDTMGLGSSLERLSPGLKRLTLNFTVGPRAGLTGCLRAKSTPPATGCGPGPAARGRSTCRGTPVAPRPARGFPSP